MVNEDDNNGSYDRANNSDIATQTALYFMMITVLNIQDILHLLQNFKMQQRIH